MKPYLLEWTAWSHFHPREHWSHARLTLTLAKKPLNTQGGAKAGSCCEHTEQGLVPVELLISYCVISHGNDCKPTFAPACVFDDIHMNVLSYKCAQNNSMCPLCMLHGCLSRSPLGIWSWKIKEQIAISLGKTLRPQEYPALEEDSIDLLHWSHLLCHA